MSGRWLLAATALALAASLVFRGNRFLAAVCPIIGLAVLQRVLVQQLHKRHAMIPDPSSSPAASDPLGRSRS